MQIARRRLAAQQIVRPRLAEPRDLVAWLGAVQAQDYAAARWAVGLRLAGGGATDAAIDRAVADGAIIRVHAMRGTWQLIAPEDVRWILALVAPRMIARLAGRHRQLGLDARTIRRSQTALARALRGGRHLRRDELAAALARAGISTEGQRLAHLLGHAELEGLLCNGPRRGKQPTYALLDEWVPARGATLARDAALAELARRYFQSRGPATAADLAWWAGLTLTEARTAVAAAAATLVSEVAGGRTYWHGGGAAPAPTRTAHLLPAFDEYLVGYKDRDAVLAPEHAARVNDGGGMLDPCVVLDGRVIGTWRRVLDRRTVAITIDPFEALPARAHRAIAAAADRYAAFVGLEPRVTLATGKDRSTVKR